MRKNKVKYIALFILFTLIFARGNLIQAEEIALNRALQMGLDNNTELQNIYDEIEGLEKDLRITEASRSWNIDIDSSYVLHEEEGIREEEGITGENTDNTSQDRIQLNFNKTTGSGLNFSPQYNYNIEDESGDYSLGIQQKLYPLVPDELGRQKYANELDLKLKQKEYEKEKTEKLLNWIESYHTAYTQKQRIIINEQRLAKSEDDLAEVEKQKEKGEAGEVELLEAKLAVKDAEENLMEAENNFKQTRDNFYQQLGIEGEGGVDFSQIPEWLINLQENIEEVDFLSKDKEKMVDVMKEDSLELQSNQVEIDKIKEEISWFKKESGPDITLEGDYNNQTEAGTVALSLSYNLYDGGERKLEKEKKEDNLSQLKRQQKDINDEIENSLENMLDEIELSQKGLERAGINRDKTEMEAELAEERQKRGAIDKPSLREKEFASKEAVISQAEAEFKYFINKMELAEKTDHFDRDLVEIIENPEVEVKNND